MPCFQISRYTTRTCADFTGILKIKGSNFFELHAKFEELYRDAQEKIDELAEQILTLGQTSLHTFEDYLQQSGIKVYKNLSNDREIVQALVDMLQVLLVKEREVIEAAGKADDEGTADLITPLLQNRKKPCGCCGPG